MDHAYTPRILLAEDDPVSMAFLAEALRSLGLEVRAVGDGESALQAARVQRFDALMLDHHLPGMHGDAVLRDVRDDPHAASRKTPAIAATAEPDPAIQAGLRAAGFAQVLTKPLNRDALRAALRELGIAVAQPPTQGISALDDEAGLRASGSVQALTALRSLFARELDLLGDQWSVVLPDDFALAERLHKLRAACGFCGARALQSAAENLSAALRGAAPEHIAQSRTEFEEALAATREALRRM